MECKYCGAQNEEDAVFCCECGKRLDGKKTCPNCGEINNDSAKFCKKCGTSFQAAQATVVKEKKQKEKVEKTEKNGLKLAKLIFKIVSLCVCALVIVLAFASCFTAFVSAGNESLNMFDVIKHLKDYQDPLADDTYGMGFYFTAENLSNIFILIGICFSMIGCIVALALGIHKAVTKGVKKELPDLENTSWISVSSLMIGLLVVGLCSTYAKIELPGNTTAQGTSYGGFVSAIFWLGVAWFFITHIADLVFDIIEGISVKEIALRVLKVLEVVFLLVILFTAVSSFITITGGNNESFGISMSATVQTSIISFLEVLSGRIYARIQANLEWVVQGSGVEIGYYITIVILVIYIITLAISAIYLFVRLQKNEKNKKPNLVLASILTVAMVVQLVISLVAIKGIYTEEEGVLEYVTLGLGLTSYGEAQSSIGSGMIVSLVFTFLLLATEIGWAVVKKDVDSTENVALNEAN